MILDTEKGQTTLEIEQVKFFKNMVILKFKGYDNINDVETWRQKDLLITREQAVTLQPDEYFITDLIGLRKGDTGAEVGNCKRCTGNRRHDDKGGGSAKWQGASFCLQSKTVF